MNLLIGSLSMGFLLSLLTLGVFITFRVMGRLDLTTDGSFGLGAAVAAALLASGVDPLVATVLAAAAGWLAGLTTGLMNLVLGIDTLLAGILVTTGLYTIQLRTLGGGNRSLAGLHTLPDAAERVWHGLRLPETLTLAGTAVSANLISTLLVCAVFVLFSIWVLARFLRTDLGLALRAAGGNPQAARALGLDTGWLTTLGLVLANGLVALAGALFAQYQGFADVSMQIGQIVTALACLVLGEGLIGKRTLRRQILGTLVGTIAYRLLVAVVVRAGLPPDDLKLATALFVLAALGVPAILTQLRRRIDRAPVGLASLRQRIDRPPTDTR
jgi:putative tryptophan/tyrosine transport system permease protein